MAKQSSLSKSERLLVILVAAFVALMLAFACWIQANNDMPVINVPAPATATPDHKALDCYLRAYNAVVPYNIPTTNGPFTLTFDGLSSRNALQQKLGGGPGIAASQGKRQNGIPPQPSLAELRELVRLNEPAFAAARTGFKYDYRIAPVRSFYGYNPEFSKLHTIARNLALAAEVKRISGDWNGAATDALDAMRLGSDMPRGAPLFGTLVGVALQTSGRNVLEDTFDHLDAAHARAAARRLEEMDLRHTPFADVLQEEKWCFLAGLQEVFRKAHWQPYLGVGPPTFANIAKALTTSKRQIVTDFTRYTDAAITRARLPYANAGPEPPSPNDVFIQDWVRMYARARVRDAECQAKNDLLMLEFALRAYRLEHGNYPAALEQLAPGHLQAIPTDPFGAGEILKYQRTTNGYTLYSNGPNGKDDHGTVDDIVVKKP